MRGGQMGVFWDRRLWRAAAAALLTLAACAAAAGDAPGEMTMTPIGQVTAADGRSVIHVDESYRPALLGLEAYSHVWVIWWFDRNDTPERRAILQVHPRRDSRNPLTGVFATRAPVRPNLIGLSLCRIVAVEDGRVEVEGIDAYPGTPVLDLKPYLPGVESVPGAVAPQRY